MFEVPKVQGLELDTANVVTGYYYLENGYWEDNGNLTTASQYSVITSLMKTDYTEKQPNLHYPQLYQRKKL